MKLLVISDFHGALEYLEPMKECSRDLGVEAVLFCGDVVKGHARGDEWLAARNEGRPPRPELPAIDAERAEDLDFYATFYSSMNELWVPTYVVPGNMDAPFSRYVEVAEEAVDTRSQVVFAHGRTLPLGKDFALIGVGGELTPSEREDHFVLRLPEWEARYSCLPARISDRPVILLTHMPPVGAAVDLTPEGHKGSAVVNRLIDLTAPSYLFCGHAHEAQAQEELAGTVIVNPGALKNGCYAFVDTEFRRIQLSKL